MPNLDGATLEVVSTQRDDSSQYSAAQSSNLGLFPPTASSQVRPHGLLPCFCRTEELIQTIIENLKEGESPEKKPSNFNHANLLCSAELADFLQENPDPALWFTRTFHCVDLDKIKARITPIGISFQLESDAYNKFVFDQGIRISDNEPISLGVTLTLPSLPKKLHNLFMVVNTGNRNSDLDKAAQEIFDTELHEALHLVFNKFFCRSRFISYIELKDRLAEMNPADLQAHRKLAQELAEGMIEVSRSEVVSYFGTGYCQVTRQHLCGNFWKKHIEVIKAYLNDNPQIDRKATCKIYLDACHYYSQQVREILRFARNLNSIQERSGQAEFIAKLLEYCQPFEDISTKLPRVKSVNELAMAA